MKRHSEDDTITRQASRDDARGRAIRVIDSPIGPLRLTAERSGLVGIEFSPFRSATERTGGDAAAAREILTETAAQLDRYFARRLTAFDLPLDPRGTPFQLRVWQLLREIPFGGATSYGELAARLGDPGAARAVGAANGRNPLPIVVPCHRVIGSTGSLTGFGGGIERKRWLLVHEGVAPESFRW